MEENIDKSKVNGKVEGNNPFDSMTEEDLDAYFAEMEREHMPYEIEQTWQLKDILSKFIRIELGTDYYPYTDGGESSIRLYTKDNKCLTIFDLSNGTNDEIMHHITDFNVSKMKSGYYLLGMNQKKDKLEKNNNLINNTAMKIYGKLVDSFGKKYLLLYNTNDTVYEIEEIEKNAIEGCRIIKYVYRLYRRIGDFINTDYRYGLLNEKNELVSSPKYVYLCRNENGNISAEYPNKSKYKDPFKCTLTPKGYPLFYYNKKDKKGNNIPMHCTIYGADVVSKCYYGIAKFVKDQKVGIIDYKGKVLLDAEFEDIEIDVRNNCFVTIQKIDDSLCYCPIGSRKESASYIFHCNKKFWPLSFTRIQDKYYVEEYFETHGIFKLKNKTNKNQCLCLYTFEQLIYSDEYKEITWAYDRKEDSIFIVKNHNDKYGCLCISKEIVSVDENTGDATYKKPYIICPLEFDNIHKPYFGDNKYLIIFKDGKDGIYSCAESKIIMECLIPAKKNIDSIMINTLKEGLVGCKKELDEGKNLEYFSDLNGNVAVKLPSHIWHINGGFNKGVAVISSRTEWATIDLNGNITVTEKIKPTYYEDSWDDIDSMYRDAFEDDPGAEWNVY